MGGARFARAPPFLAVPFFLTLLIFLALDQFSIIFFWAFILKNDSSWLGRATIPLPYSKYLESFEKNPKKIGQKLVQSQTNQKCKKKGTAKNGGARAKRAPPHFCFVHFRVHF